MKDNQGKNIRAGKTLLKQIRDNINKAKRNLVTPTEYRKQASGEVEELSARVFDLYDDTIHSRNLLDFNDQINGMIKFWQDQPDMYEAYKKYWSTGFILADEAQGFSRNNLEWIRMLTDVPSPRVTLVGDPNQSIMNFDGPGGEKPFEAFERFYPQANRSNLVDNYRSPKAFLDIAQKILSAGNSAQSQNLRSVKGDTGEKPKYYIADTVDDEINFVVDQVKQFQDLGYDLSDIAVFGRTHQELAKFSRAFSQAKIPAKVSSKEAVFEEPQVKKMLDFLTVLNDPSLNTGLANMITSPGIAHGFGEESLKNAQELATKLEDPKTGKRGITLFEALGRLDEMGAIGKKKPGTKIINAAKSFVKFVEGFDSENRSITEAFDYILKNTKFKDKLDAKRRGKLEKLREDIAQYEHSISGERDEGTNLSQDLVRYLKQVREGERKVLDEDLGEDVVQLSTMHSGRGQEFRLVFATGFSEGSVPHERAKRGELEQEQRLAYVTATRAQEQLYITSPRSKIALDPVTGEYREIELEESRFLADAVPDEDYHLIDKDYRS